MWGTGESKYHILSAKDIESTGWKDLEPNSPFYFFVPKDEKLRPEYEKGWKVTDVFVFSGQGFTSSRDDFAVAFSLAEIKHRLNILIGPNYLMIILGTLTGLMKQADGIDKDQKCITS